MKIKSALVTQISGSIGGMTGAHNRGGLYLRSRTIPTDPASSTQITRRFLFGLFSANWASGLTDAQREAWNLYASNVPVLDKLGDSIFLSGQQWYVGSATLRAIGVPPAVSNGPTNFTRPSFTAPSSITITTPTSIGFTYDDTEDWVSEDGAGLLVFAGRPVSPGINFFKGPFRFAGVVLGSVGSPPSSPASLTNPFTTTADQKQWLRFVLTRADGRYSPSITLGPFTVTV